MSPDREIELKTAFAALDAALGPAFEDDREASASATSAPDRERRVEWPDAFKKIISGAEYHPALAPLAASYAAWEAPEQVTYNTLRSLMLISKPADPERQRRRDVEIEKLEDTVASAYAKFGKPAGAAGPGEESTTAPGWKKIDSHLLFSAKIPSPELIHDMLPPGWVDLIWASAFAAAAAPDYGALAAVVASAGAIGNARVARASAGWKEAIVLWGALVGEPSRRKTPSMNDVRETLTSIDKKLDSQWRLACDKLEADYETELAQAPQKKKVKKPAKPPLPQLLHDDVTLEKLTISMASNPHGALVFYDELASWLSSFSRYSADGDASGARAFWNKAYNAGRHKRDRVKMEGPPIVVEATACSVAGAIQPERLRQFWTTANDGMLARLVLVWPELTAAKTIEFNGEEREREDLMHKLKRAYLALYGLKPDMKDGEPRPKAISLAVDAQALFGEARRGCEGKARKECGVFAEWLGKGPGRILRLALTFEFMTWALEPTAAEPEEIGADAMGRAIRYHEYLEQMFLRVMAGIEPAETGGDALAVARLIVERQWSHFALRDIGREPGFRWFRGEQRGMKERRDNALKCLADANVIRRETVKTSGGIFEKWAVNPDLPAAFSG